MDIENIKENLLIKQGEELIEFIDKHLTYPGETLDVRIYDLESNIKKLKEIEKFEKAIILGKLEKIIQEFKAINLGLIIITLFITVITDYGRIFELIINQMMDEGRSEVLSLGLTIAAVLGVIGLFASQFDKARRRMLTANYLKILLEEIKE